MDPIRLLLSLVLGLFPRLLHLTAIPLAVVPRYGSRQQLREYAIGHDRTGWYRVTLEVNNSHWPAMRVIAISDWSRIRPGNSGDHKDNSVTHAIQRQSDGNSPSSVDGKRST